MDAELASVLSGRRNFHEGGRCRKAGKTTIGSAVTDRSQFVAVAIPRVRD
jgi:hypothetical protein